VTPRSTQRGFTLIELMVSMLVGSLLVILILSIFSRISFAYREQQRLAGVHATLTAARQAIEHDARQAGLLMPQGFTVAIDKDAGLTVRRSPVRVVNSATAPDAVAFFYADLDMQAIVLAAPAPTNVDVTIDSDPGFADGDLVVLATPTAVASPIDPANDAKIIQYETCIVQIENIAGTALTFSVAAPWGRPLNDHCTVTPSGGATIVAKLVARYWRIDNSSAARSALGVLQLDTTGALEGIVASNFSDMAYGVVDLQAATYFYDGDGADSDDPDSDANRDWYSSTAQDTNTQSLPIASAFPPPLMMSFSVVARTAEDSEGIFTAATPELRDASNVNNNPIGDRASETLPSASNDALKGKRLYRYLTFKQELRNIGVGR
jgi:prepilin-type N-terminal cleavage/methylation domain-containing protein